MNERSECSCFLSGFHEYFIRLCSVFYVVNFIESWLTFLLPISYTMISNIIIISVMAPLNIYLKYGRWKSEKFKRRNCFSVRIWSNVLFDLRGCNNYIHTYIHNWHYNPSVRIIDLVSHTTYIVCVNFIHKWRDLQFKVDS